MGDGWIVRFRVATTDVGALVNCALMRMLAFAAILALAGCPSQEPSTVELHGFVGDSGAVQASLGKFFLIRLGDQHAAVKLTKTTTKGDGGAKYTWYYQSGGSGSFTDESATRGQGEVFERYRRVKKTEDGWHVENNGGVLLIVCDKLRVQWSQSNWIYFDTPQGVVEIALTGKANIDDINYLDPALTWRAGNGANGQNADRGRE